MSRRWGTGITPLLRRRLVVPVAVLGAFLVGVAVGVRLDDSGEEPRASSAPNGEVPRDAAEVASGAPHGVPPGGPPASPSIPCSVFPENNYWHADVSGLPVHPESNRWLGTIDPDVGVHADFGSGLYEGSWIGIPYTVVGSDQPRVDVTFEYADESDRGPYPIPPDAPLEGGPEFDPDNDRHVLVVERDSCTLYELWDAAPRDDGSWSAGSGAVFDLTSNELRPRGFTSADGAGLPILPGLVRYDEVASGAIDHAVRFTFEATQDAYVWPARHEAGEDDPSLPPMGAWLRLKGSFDVSAFPPELQVILRAMQVHGLILADNGSSLFITGVPDSRWDNDMLALLGDVTAESFEFVDTSSLMVEADSGEAAR